MKHNKPIEGAGSTTTSKSIMLWWNQRKHSLDVPLSKCKNMVTFTSAPRFNRYTAHCQESQVNHQQEDSNPIVAFSVSMRDEEPPVKESKLSNMHHLMLKHDLFNGRNETLEPLMDEHKITNDEAELLQCHSNFGHVPFTKLKAMAKQGIMPTRLAKCNNPVCAACVGGMIKEKNWRDKPQKSYEVAKAQHPGEIVSVDMLMSPTPRLIDQMSSFLTKKRYRYVTTYVDNFSKLGFAYLQSESSVEATLKGKRAWEQFAVSHGVVCSA